MDRNCDNCARCGRDGCKSWDCDYIPRDEAIEAWKEKYGTVEPQTDCETCTQQTDCPWK